MTKETGKQTLLLKWGTLKGWENISSEKCKDLLKKYHDIGASMSCAMQKDTTEQKQIICDLIDAVDEVSNDWTGKKMSKAEAKKYVMEYRA